MLYYMYIWRKGWGGIGDLRMEFEIALMSCSSKERIVKKSIFFNVFIQNCSSINGACTA